MRKKYLIIFLLYILFNTKTLATSDILLNEILIDPPPQRIELINIGTESADISGYILDDSGGLTYFTIPQSTNINPNSCLVFEGDFNLNKTSSDTARLINKNISSSSAIIDQYFYKSSPGSNISFQRIPDGDEHWEAQVNSLGLFNQSKNSCIIIPTPTSVPTPTNIEINISPTLIPSQFPTPSETFKSSSFSNIYINEVMVNPLQNENEWIEIFNNNDYSINNLKWYVDDPENSGSTPKLFDINIDKFGYQLITMNSSIYNNDSDQVRLLDQNKNIIDSIEYDQSTSGLTWGRISLDSDSFCMQNPSPLTKNYDCLQNNFTTSVKSSNYLPTLSTSVLGESTIKDKKPLFKIIPRTINSGNLVNNNKNITLNVNISKQKKSPIKLLLFLSCFYSLLTLLSILFKMKLINEKFNRFFS